MKTITQKLADIVGKEYVEDDEAILQVYSADMTVEQPSLPDVVAMPKTVEQIQRILGIANRERIPVIPFVTGTNMGGLAIPREGGIILDLKRMNSILDVNEDSMYTIVEPGVSSGDLQRYLNKNHPNLRFSCPASPAFTSIVANYLLAGLGTLSMKMGCHADAINGLEAVLPTGEVIKTGSCAGSPYWFGRYPLPDFSGLFVDWQGTMGIVTKMAIQLWPKPPFTDVIGVALWNIDDLPIFQQRFIKTELVEEQSGRNYEFLAGTRGETPKKGPNSWEILLFMTISAYSEKLFNAKIEMAEEIVKEEKAKGMKVDFLPEYNRTELARRTVVFPTVGPLVKWMDVGASTLKPGGGAAWCGGYLPLQNVPAGYKKGKKLLENYNFTPMVGTRTMGLGRYSIMRFIIPYNKSDADEVERVRKALREIARIHLDSGSLMYKAPDWAARMQFDRCDPGYVELLRKTKKFLDPNRIMNPGHLGL